VSSSLADRIRGALFGQAVGDALGFGAEFLSRADVRRLYPAGLSSYEQITRFRPCDQWQPGDWTDDTDQMLCVLDSLLEHGTLAPRDIAARLHRWALDDGFGMGSTFYAVARSSAFVESPEKVAREYWESTGRNVASNGGVMRTSVLGLWQFRDADAVRRNAEAVCLLTHADPRCVGSCVAVCLALRGLLLGEEDVPRLLDAVAAQTAAYHPELAWAFTQAREPTLEGLDLDEGMNPGEANRLGYTLKTLGAALWALAHARSFEEGVSALIHEGGDADTNAAVAGALLGARFGHEAIPSRWVSGLVHGAALEQRGVRLIELSRPL
jgi:ADP-ribosylglycohydrolase